MIIDFSRGLHATIVTLLFILWGALNAFTVFVEIDPNVGTPKASRDLFKTILTIIYIVLAVTLVINLIITLAQNW